MGGVEHTKCVASSLQEGNVSAETVSPNIIALVDPALTCSDPL